MTLDPLTIDRVISHLRMAEESLRLASHFAAGYNREILSAKRDVGSIMDQLKAGQADLIAAPFNPNLRIV